MSDSPNQPPEMRLPLSAARTQELTTNLSRTLSLIRAALPHPSHPSPRLVLVSKLKPANEILALHTSSSSSPDHQALHFGENYVQELIEKSRLLPKTIRWHFIGGLQSNKCKSLVEEVGAGLWCVESVDSVKKAGLLDRGRGVVVEREKEGEGEDDDRRLRVFVQVNTSGEEGKSGVGMAGGEVVQLCRFVEEECEHLRLMGLMTIGALARSAGELGPGRENEDFVKLGEVRERVERELGFERGRLELSMGMSQDFESAVRCGSQEVRVGSGIFGERPARKEAKVLNEGAEGGG